LELEHAAESEFKQRHFEHVIHVFSGSATKNSMKQTVSSVTVFPFLLPLSLRGLMTSIISDCGRLSSSWLSSPTTMMGAPR
jgi:hypothetical protein